MVADMYCRVSMKQDGLPCIYRLLSPIFLCSYLELIATEILIVLQSILGWTSTVGLSYSVQKWTEY